MSSECRASVSTFEDFQIVMGGRVNSRWLQASAATVICCKADAALDEPLSGVSSMTAMSAMPELKAVETHRSKVDNPLRERKIAE
jgi:hypothetical protein